MHDVVGTEREGVPHNTVSVDTHAGDRRGGCRGSTEPLSAAGSR